MRYIIILLLCMSNIPACISVEDTLAQDLVWMTDKEHTYIISRYKGQEWFGIDDKGLITVYLNQLGEEDQKEAFKAFVGLFDWKDYPIESKGDKVEPNRNKK